MKKMLLVLIMFTVMTFAVEEASSADRYIGPKTGIMLIDVRGADDIIPIGAVYSHRLNKIIPDVGSENLWFEGEFNLGILGGDVDFGPVSGDIDIWTLAGYVAYQHPLNNDAYLKGKAGLLYEKVEVSSGFGSGSDSEIELSLGFGGGFKINDRMTGEVEYTIIESDVHFLSFALKFPLD